MPILLAILVGACLQTAPPPEVDPSRPNIILIVADNMGWGDLGCYGSPAIETPNLDRLASEGVRFVNGYSGAPLCAPSRSNLMTGLHSGHGAVRAANGRGALLSTDVTIAEVLKERDYVTGGFGKWGLGDIGSMGEPERQGFDEFFGYYHHLHAHNYFPRYLVHNGDKVPLKGNGGGGREQFAPYVIVDQMKRFIRENADRPFFCYGPWTMPHPLYVIPESDPAHALYTDKPWPDKVKGHAAYVSLFDRQVGEIWDVLKELGIDEHTIIVVTSDNGPPIAPEYAPLQSTGPFQASSRRGLYESAIRVPLIVRGPLGAQRGVVTEHLAYSPDLLPTFADIAGVPEASWTHSDGLSFLPELFAEEQPAHDFLYWEIQGFTFSERGRLQSAVLSEARGLAQAVREDDWKLVRREAGKPWELYNLTKDPGETNELAGSHPDIVERLAAHAADSHTPPRPQYLYFTMTGQRYE